MVSRVEGIIREIGIVKLKALAMRHKLKRYWTSKKDELVSMLLTKVEALGGFYDSADDDEFDWSVMPASERDYLSMKGVWSWFNTQNPEKEALNRLQVGRTCRAIDLVVLI